MKKPMLFVSLVVGAALVCGCTKVACECADGLVGLVISTDAPVTSVTLSGAACAKGRFRCLPEKFDNTIHGECKELQIEAQAEGTCTGDLTVGGTAVRVERLMTYRPADSNGCCGGFFGEANHAGQIDLRARPDGGRT